MLDHEITDYIIFLRMQGATSDDIRKSLSLKGYSPEFIETAFAEARNSLLSQ